MPLKQSSLRDFYPTIARKVWLVGLGEFRKGSPVNSKPQHGAFLFGPSAQQTAPTTSISMDSTPLSNNQKQKRKEDTEESEQEEEVKRVKISKPDASSDLADDADEAVYEPQPKHRKLTPSHGLSTELSTGSYASNSPVSEDDEFADNEEDNTGSEDGGPTQDAPSTTHLLTADTPIDSDSDDESFVPEASDRAGTDGGNASASEDDVSSLTWASPATIQPISPVTPSTPGTGINMYALNRSLPRLPPTPRTSRRRQAAPFVIYEDAAATPPSDDDSIEQIWMPAARQSILAPLDRGQENRQPLFPVVEAPVEMLAQFLQEDGGSDEEMEMELYE